MWDWVWEWIKHGITVFFFSSKLIFLTITASKWKYLSGNGAAARGLLIAAFHQRKSRGKEAKVSKLTGQDRVLACICVHVCFFKLQKQKKIIVTAISILTLPRLRAGSPFLPLAVIPSKTLTEGHKAFYWMHPLSRKENPFCENTPRKWDLGSTEGCGQDFNLHLTDHFHTLPLWPLYAARWSTTGTSTIVH